jgi:hypothetical protein
MGLVGQLGAEIPVLQNRTYVFLKTACKLFKSDISGCQPRYDITSGAVIATDCSVEIS